MNIQTFLENILLFLNKTIVPFLMAIAFLVFLWNVVRYFIIGGANEDDQTKAKSLALWSVSAFVIILSLWGIVNLLVYGFGFGNGGAITPDYMCQKLNIGCVAPTSRRSSAYPTNYPVDNDQGYQLPGQYTTPE